MQRSGGVDDDRVDALLRFDEAHAPVDAEHEDRLRQGLGGEAVLGEDRDAVHRARRTAGGGIDDVVEAHAVGIEAALVVARRGDRDVLERQHRAHRSGPARIAHADHPGAAATVADDATVAAGKQLLIKALEQPFRILLSNSGLNAEEWLPQVKKAKAGQGVNVNDPSKLVDLKAAGIIDPAAVTRQALQNAASIAGTAMTMGALVVDVPEKAAAPAMGGGMDAMGGMM